MANLSDWRASKIQTFRRLLRDEPLVSPADLFRTLQTLPHGHVEAVLTAIRKLGPDFILAGKRCRERDLVVAMIAERLIHPCSKLATTRDWLTTTLAEELAVQDATEDDLYHAMDWLRERKTRIEQKLAQRHLTDIVYGVLKAAEIGLKVGKVLGRYKIRWASTSSTPSGRGALLGPAGKSPFSKKRSWTGFT